MTLALRMADLLRAARSGIMTAMLKAAVVLIALLSLGLGACEREQKGISQDLPAARATKARADAQAIASAVRQYQATFGSLPESIELSAPQKIISPNRYSQNEKSCFVRRSTAYETSSIPSRMSRLRDEASWRHRQF